MKLFVLFLALAGAIMSCRRDDPKHDPRLQAIDHELIELRAAAYELNIDEAQSRPFGNSFAPGYGSVLQDAQARAEDERQAAAHHEIFSRKLEQNLARQQLLVHRRELIVKSAK